MFIKEGKRVDNLDINIPLDEEVLVVPDVHGREFWRDAQNYKGKIIFLGDYVDPYPVEGILPEEAYNRFIEIIEFAKSNPNVVLLVGNHDYQYIHRPEIMSRPDLERYDQLRSLFRDNIKLFHLYHKINNVYFAHAAITRDWLDSINKQSIEDVDMLDVNSIWRPSWYRWGNYQWGSCIWEDLRESLEHQDSLIGDYQIFGHTALYSEPTITEKFACLDTQQLYLIKNDVQTFKVC